MRIVHQHRSTAQQPDDSLAALQPHIVERLHAEGIDSLAAWRHLGRRRLAIFGITRAMVQEIDAAAARDQRVTGRPAFALGA